MHPLDWLVMALYAALVLVIGWRTGRGHQSTDDFFLGRRTIPAAAVFCSLVATELSAATFLGVPHDAYTGDWSYLQFLIGSLAARLVLATWFIGLYHRMRLITVYGLLEQRFGRGPQLLGAWFFLLGRLLASGVRLYIAGLAFATVTGLSLEGSILVAGLLAGVYTLCGGIRAVIWTDTLQGAVFLIAAAASLVALAVGLDGGLPALLERAGAEGRLDVFQLPPLLSAGTSAAEGWAALGAIWEGFREHYLARSDPLVVMLLGGFFLTLATHGTDQDMVQRLLTTRTGRQGGGALVATGLVNFPLVALFLLLGTALWAYYQADLGAFGGDYSIADDKRIFAIFVFQEMPAGLRGLIFAGLFAAAMSSLDSALNSLVTTWVVDVRRRAEAPSGMATTRLATVVFGVLLVGAALFFVPYERHLSASGATRLSLVELALSAMTIVYGALLGAFLVALATRRGTSRSVVTGMLVAALLGAVLFLQPLLLRETVVAWPWWIPITATVAFTIGAAHATRAVH